MIRARTVLPPILGVLVATLLLAWTLRRGGAEALSGALAALSWTVVVPAVGFESVVHLSRAARWTAVLHGRHQVRYANVLSAVLVGTASTQVIPLRLDEVLRAWLLSRREGLSRADLFGTVIIDRLGEILLLIGVLAVLASRAGLPDVLRGAAGALATLGLAGVTGVVVARRSADPLERWLRQRGSTSLAGFVAQGAEGLRGLPRGRYAVVFVVTQASELLATAGLYAWLLHSFGHDELPLALPLLMALGGLLAYAVPNVPGALGSYEFVITALLEGVVGLAPGPALTIALAAHALLFVPVTLAGAAAGLREWLQARGEAPA